MNILERTTVLNVAVLALLLWSVSACGGDSNAAVVDAGGTTDTSVTRDAATTDVATADVLALTDAAASADATTDATRADVRIPADATGSDASLSDGGGTLSAVVVNEIQAVGSDWIELIATRDVSLSGWIITDDATGSPHVGHRTALPTTLSLTAGERLIVAENTEPVIPPGVQTNCEIGTFTAARCVWVGFGLSAAAGDAVYLFEGATQRDVLRVAPAALPNDESRSWCRLPDATGAGALCGPSFNAVNVAP